MTPVVQARGRATVPPLLASVFEEFAQESIGYCLLRGYEELLNGTVDGDVDLLVAPDQFGRARAALERLGFVALSRWGQGPHRFFIGYDEAGDRWIKLDIVTELAYGRPIPALRTPLATQCLSNRRRYGPVFVPAAEDELLALLLHCLLDKGTIEPAYRSRLAALAGAIGDDASMAAQVARCFPPATTWDQLKQAIDCGDWDALLKTRAGLAAHLARRDPLETRRRRVAGRMLRFLDRRTRAVRDRGLTVALLAPDGAGKTTLARGLGREFYLPTRYIYMGTNPNSNSLTLPTTRWLARLGAGGRRPLVRTLSALNSLVEQALRYRVGAYHRGRGRLVVFDRYTTAALGAEQRGGALHKRARRWVMRKLCPPPDMVVFLDAPAEVLYRRKREHSPQLLEQQRQHYLELLRGDPRTVIVDARRKPYQVRRRVTGLIWRRYAENRKGG